MDEATTGKLGMKLANRAYIYRLFHIVFGAIPSFDEFKALAARETLDAFALLAEETGDAIFSDAKRQCETLAQHVEDEELLDQVKTEYQRLFMVPGKGNVSPWESPYVGQESQLFQESTIDVRNRYREWGFAVQQGHYPEDHIAMMCEFMAALYLQAHEALLEGDDEAVERIRLFLASFSAAHLGVWVDSFAAGVEQKDRTGFYVTLAYALAAFLKVEREG